MDIYPALKYHDAPAAIDWLERALGFTTKERHDGEDGTVQHAVLVSGDAAVMLGTEPPGGDPYFGEHAGQSWIYAAVEDPDALHERAVAAGAEVARAIEDTDYGSREFSVRDPEGNVWSFGSYRP